MSGDAHAPYLGSVLTCRPALPPNVHRKYVEPIKELILSGLQQPNEGHTLSLIFQGLANLAKFEDWGSGHKNQLVLDLLEMSQEIPKDSQHASLKAISRLLSVPREGIDVYDLLVSVHATFGSKNVSLDMDLKALVAEVYGHLGTVERNVSGLLYSFRDTALIDSIARDQQSGSNCPYRPGECVNTYLVSHRIQKPLSIGNDCCIPRKRCSDRKRQRLVTERALSSNTTSIILSRKLFSRC